MIYFNRSSNDKKYNITIALDATVADLKELVAAEADIPADRQRIIYSGRVLKDPETIETYKIKSGQTVHLIRGAAPKSTPAPSNTTSSAAAGTSSAGSTTSSTNTATPNLPSSFATGGTVGNPLADLTGARYAGYANLPSASMFGPDGGMGPPPDVDDLVSLLNQPGVRDQFNEMLSDPQTIDMLIGSNPQLQQMGPMIRGMLTNPYFRNMLTDPSTLRLMSQMHRSGPAANSFPAPGPADDSEEPSDTTSSNSAPSATPNTNAAAGLANPNMMNLFQNMMRGGAGAGAGAEGAGAGAPGFPSPESLAEMQQMLGAYGGLGGLGGLPGLGGLGGAQPPQETDNRPPEERYESQLRQLNELGFYDFDRNVRALRRSGGNVQGAIEALLDSLV